MIGYLKNGKTGGQSKMKDETQFERDITKALKITVGNDYEWVEWSSSEEEIRKNIIKGKEWYLKLNGVWVAYREKKGK
jgi:hypothetical protein